MKTKFFLVAMLVLALTVVGVLSPHHAIEFRLGPLELRVLPSDQLPGRGGHVAALKKHVKGALCHSVTSSQITNVT